MAKSKRAKNPKQFVDKTLYGKPNIEQHEHLKTRGYTLVLIALIWFIYNIRIIFSVMWMFCRSLFVLLYVSFWPLCCPFFFDLRILIAPLDLSALLRTVLSNQIIRFRHNSLSSFNDIWSCSDSMVFFFHFIHILTLF